MIKKRQHYVWQHYLNAWTNEKKQIWCKQRNKIFVTSTENIGVESFFYQIPELNQPEYECLKKLCNNPNRPEIQDFIDAILMYFYMPSRLASIIDKNEYREPLLIFLINALEDLHSKIELDSINILEKLKNCDNSFMDNEEDRMKLILFLVFQYTRTKKIQNKLKILKLPHSLMNEKIDTNKILWPRIVTMNYQIIFGILSCNKTYRLNILNNKTNISFITGDQPVINIAERKKNDKIKELILYYPISPKIAILVSNNLHKNENVDITEINQVKQYNKSIVQESLEQIYGNQKIDIENLQN